MSTDGESNIDEKNEISQLLIRETMNQCLSGAEKMKKLAQEQENPKMTPTASDSNVDKAITRPESPSPRSGGSNAGELAQESSRPIAQVHQSGANPSQVNGEGFHKDTPKPHDRYKSVLSFLASSIFPIVRHLAQYPGKQKDFRVVQLYEGSGMKPPEGQAEGKSD